MDDLQLQALLPFIVLASASIIIILLIAFRSSHTVIQVVGFLMMCMVVFAMWYVRHTLPRAINPLFIVDGIGALFEDGRFRNNIDLNVRSFGSRKGRKGAERAQVNITYHYSF